MKPGGVPDSTRAARIVLKDFVQGKLNYCKAPPDVAQVYFSLFKSAFYMWPTDLMITWFAPLHTSLIYFLNKIFLRSVLFKLDIDIETETFY